MQLLTSVAALMLGINGALAATTAAKGVPVPSRIPKLNEKTSHGCYSSSGDLVKLEKILDFPSSGSCTDACIARKEWVSALHASDCYCGMSYPPKSSATTDSHCNYPCQGYDLEACEFSPPPSPMLSSTLVLISSCLRIPP
jgi:hypothetical protein